MIGFLFAVVLITFVSQVRKYSKEDRLKQPNRFQAGQPFATTANGQYQVIGRSTMPLIPANSEAASQLTIQTIQPLNAVDPQEEYPYVVVENEFKREPSYSAVVIMDDETDERDVMSELTHVEELFAEVAKPRFTTLTDIEENTNETMEQNLTAPLNQENEEFDMKNPFIEAQINDKTTKGFEETLNSFMNDLFVPLVDEKKEEPEPFLSSEDKNFIKQMTNFQGLGEYQPTEKSPVQHVVLTLDELYDENNVDAQFLKFAPLFADEYEHKLVDGVSGFRSWFVQVVGREGDYLHVTDGTGRLWLDAENFSNKSIEHGDYLTIDAQDGEMVTLTVLNIEDLTNENAYIAVS